MDHGPSAPPLLTEEGKEEEEKLSTSFSRQSSLSSADRSSSSTSSVQIPTAPPFEPVFTNPISEVEFTISASSLLNLDQVSRSDPICVVFIQDSTTKWEWIELGRTETIMNDLSPEWNTKFLLDYRFEEKQMLTFMVYDKDKKRTHLTRESHDFLGKLECTLAEIISAPHSKFTKALKLPYIHLTCKNESRISIISEELGDCKKFIRFQICCKELRDIKPTSTPKLSRKLFINISSQLPDGSWILLTRTERILINDSELKFPFVSIRYSSVCKKGNLEAPLRLQLHIVEYSFRGKLSKLVGETITSFVEISEKCESGETADFQLFRGKSGVDAVPVGKLLIQEFVIESQKTFMDYLQDNLEIQFSVAIDFTASNGEPTRNSSLHYKHGKKDNPYVTTLKIVGEILQDYSSSKQFYAYGFGAKGFPCANRVNHKFPLNFKESNPSCDGIDGILKSYYRSLQRVKLFGPTCFAPIIREVAEIAKRSMIGSDTSNKYFVLLILTDGIVCDPETTMDALVEASFTPMSIIIVGIGDEDFAAMEKFDSDEKLLTSRTNKTAFRDIVQFVELRRYMNFRSVLPISEASKIALTRSVLAELPQQVVTWMNRKNPKRGFI